MSLHPYSQWPAGMVKADLIAQLSRRFAQIPGIVVGFSQPMIDGVNDKIAGAHSDLVVKIFASDLGEARRLAERMVGVLQTVRGSADVAIDQEPPLPQLQVTVDRAAAARHGINVADIALLIEVAIGGRAVAQVYQGRAALRRRGALRAPRPQLPRGDRRLDRTCPRWCACHWPRWRG